jgi:hypothetical protein
MQESTVHVLLLVVGAWFSVCVSITHTSSVSRFPLTELRLELMEELFRVDTPSTACCNCCPDMRATGVLGTYRTCCFALYERVLPRSLWFETSKAPKSCCSLQVAAGCFGLHVSTSTGVVQLTFWRRLQGYVH